MKTYASPRSVAIGKLFFFLVFLAGTPDVLFLFAMEGGFLVFGDAVAFDAPYFFVVVFRGVTVFFRAGTTFAAFFDGAGFGVVVRAANFTVGAFLAVDLYAEAAGFAFGVTFFGVLAEVVRTFFVFVFFAEVVAGDLFAETFFVFVFFVEVVAGDFLVVAVAVTDFLFGATRFFVDAWRLATPLPLVIAFRLFAASFAARFSLNVFVFSNSWASISALSLFFGIGDALNRCTRNSCSFRAAMKSLSSRFFFSAIAMASLSAFSPPLL